MADYYDKPCDWEKQEKEYNERWAKYCRHNNAYNIVCGQLREYYNWVEENYEFDPPENTTRQQNNFRIMDTVKMYSTNKTNEKNNDLYEYAYIDSGSDTFGIGGNAWVH